MNFNQGSNKTFQAGSWWYDVSQRKGRVPQNAVVAITAYSCITSSIPNHASFISNFSKPREEKPAEDSQRRIHRSAARATVSGALEEKWKKRKRGEKKNPWALKKRSIYLWDLRWQSVQGGEPSLVVRHDEPRTAYIGEWAGEKFSVGIKGEARANLEQKKKKKKKVYKSTVQLIHTEPGERLLFIS